MAIYTKDQLERYYAYIDLPQKYRSTSPELTLDFLTSLHVHQISAIPYENLLIHYSASYTVSLDPQEIYQKIVINARGRGGYCMELATFYNHLLRSIGFDALTVGVRIRPRIGGVPAGDYIGWVHVVNIVTLPSGSKYMVDVGFGGDGPTAPIPLEANQPMRNLGAQEVRLIHHTIPQQRDPNQRYWIYQYRNGVDKPWNSHYCFPGLEFMPEDLVVMNHYTSTDRSDTNFQTKTVLVVLFLREGSEIVGKIMMVGGEVKKNLGGKTKSVQVCKSEVERVKVLSEYFRIVLTEEEREGVHGRKAELRNAGG